MGKGAGHFIKTLSTAKGHESASLPLLPSSLSCSYLHHHLLHFKSLHAFFHLAFDYSTFCIFRFGVQLPRRRNLSAEQWPLGAGRRWVCGVHKERNRTRVA